MVKFQVRKDFSKTFYSERISDFRKVMRKSKEEHPVYPLLILTHHCRMWTGTKAGRKTCLEIGFLQSRWKRIPGVRAQEGLRYSGKIYWKWKGTPGTDAPEEAAKLPQPRPGGLAPSHCGRSPASGATPGPGGGPGARRCCAIIPLHWHPNLQQSRSVPVLL